MIALIDPFKEEMLERGFSAYHLGTRVNMLTGEISLIKSDEARNQLRRCVTTSRSERLTT